MQVRAIEFQENFRLVTLEASRLQSVLQRDGLDATERAAATLATERIENLERTSPADETEQSRPVSEGESRSQGRQDSAGRRSSDEEQHTPTNSPEPGSGIDLLA